jgi:hypothetical protein
MKAFNPVIVLAFCYVLIGIFFGLLLAEDFVFAWGWKFIFFFVGIIGASLIRWKYGNIYSKIKF